MEPCPHERRLESIERRYEALLESLKKMEDKFDMKLDMIITSVYKVSVLEEKHSYQSAALERAFSNIKEMKSNLETLEAFKNKTEGMARMAWILWGALGISVLGLVTKIIG